MVKEHGAVFDAYAYAFFFGKLDDGRPDGFEELDVLFYRFILVTAYKGGDQVDAQFGRRGNYLLEMLNVGGSFFKVGIHGVGVKGQGGDLNALVGTIL
ncbi:hypothetical protein SDC9_156308 [bioreactor metagenome]|uniref:Uncharacterized protein n=1 Tax=bioreactor metagenome TaxID=1076179 RepID=A0A645F577_9ZZZZ